MYFTPEQREHVWNLLLESRGHGNLEEYCEWRRGMLPADLLTKYGNATEIEEKIISTEGGDVKIALVQPKGGRKEKTACLVNFYGCAFFLPHTEDWTLLCRRLAADLGILVVDVWYDTTRLSSYPAQFHQAYDATKWVFEHAEELNIDPDKVAISGSSSGGNLATAVCLKASVEKEFKLKYQILIYPGISLNEDFGDIEEVTYEDLLRFASEGSRLASVTFYPPRKALAQEPYASPNCATDEMIKGLPETLIISASQDAAVRINELHDYFTRLTKNEVKVTHVDYPNSIHGYLNQCHGEYEDTYADLEHYFRKNVINK